MNLSAISKAPGERQHVDEAVLRSKTFVNLPPTQRAAFAAALQRGFLVGGLDAPCIYGAAPGARRLLHIDQEWTACGVLWAKHCKATARSCVEVSSYADGLAFVAMRFGAQAWRADPLRAGELKELLRSVVSGATGRTWALGRNWVTRAMPRSEALELARACVELDELMRAERECSLVMDS